MQELVVVERESRGVLIPRNARKALAYLEYVLGIVPEPYVPPDPESGVTVVDGTLFDEPVQYWKYSSAA